MHDNRAYEHKECLAGDCDCDTGHLCCDHGVVAATHCQQNLVYTVVIYVKIMCRKMGGHTFNPKPIRATAKPLMVHNPKP